MASDGLQGLAAIACVDGDLTRGARLIGAADAHRQGEDSVLPRLRSAFFDDGRFRCSAGAWDTAYREGQALTFEHAIAYALEDRAPTATPVILDNT